MLRFFRKWRCQHDRDAGPRLVPVKKDSRQLRETGELALGPEDLEMVAAVQTDVGCERGTNEDCGRFIRPGDPEVLAGKGVLAVIADGMGGSAAGEVASRIAVDAIGRLYYESAAPAQEALKQALLGANREILEAAQKDERLAGMGTTCVTLVVLRGEAHAAHVGDSRLYLVRAGQIYRMTEDHSMVGEMVRQGMITRQEACQHDDRNVILRALGSQPTVEIAMWDRPLPVRPGDRFLLCSDGLHDLVEEETIKETVLAQEPHAACERLIALAKQRGGYDNITVAIVSARSTQQPAGGRMRETREAEAAL